MKRRGLAKIPFDVSLRDALGERLRVLPDDCAPYAIAGTMPKAVALPRDRREAALALAAATAQGAVVVLRGAGTKSHRPPAPRDVDVVLDTRGLAGVIDHATADLTITVGAGTTLARLDEALAPAGQFWPVDAPFAATATVGGTIAANAHGPLRLRYGAIRENVLGATLVLADGTEARAGSRVVKSVAGYDIHKLMAGSFGTLALVAETTLKIAPLPQTERIALAAFAGHTPACAVARALARSSLFPMAMVLCDEISARSVSALRAHITRDGWMLLVRCGGNRRAVERQVDDVVRACAAAGAGATAVLDHEAARRAWPDVRELDGGAHRSPERVATMRVVTVPTALPDAIADARAIWPDAMIGASPAVGSLHVGVTVPDGAHAISGVGAFHDRCRLAGWPFALVSAPARASAERRFADPGGPVRLLRAVKAAFDPDGTLDPGRLAGGV